MNAKYPAHVLVVEDEKSARLMLERVLTRAGHTVTAAENGAQGLSALEREQIDLMLVDKNLPDIDGLEVIRRAKALRPAVPAIVVTAYPSPEARAVAKKLGAHDFVTKPFGITEILESCDAALFASKGAAQPTHTK